MRRAKPGSETARKASPAIRAISTSSRGANARAQRCTVASPASSSATASAVPPQTTAQPASGERTTRKGTQVVAPAPSMPQGSSSVQRRKRPGASRAVSACSGSAITAVAPAGTRRRETVSRWPGASRGLPNAAAPPGPSASMRVRASTTTPPGRPLRTARRTNPSGR